MKLSIETLKSLINNSHLDYRGKNITGQCPYCQGMEFGISVDTYHRFGCFRKGKCGETGNIFKLLKKLNRLDLLSKPDNITIPLSPYLENVITKEEGVQVSELPEISLPIGFRRITSHSYLEQRGFIREDFDRYEVGITKLDMKLRDCVIFLIRQKNRLVGYVARYIKSKEEIKILEQQRGRKILRYRNSSTDFESLLLGYDECTNKTDTVILVEGLFGKKNVDDQLQLLQQEEIKCLCTFGAKISETQLYLLHLAGINNIILFYDPDVIGQIKKYSSRLWDEFESVKIAFISQSNKDPGDLVYEEMIEVFNNLKEVLNFQLNFLQIRDLK